MSRVLVVDDDRQLLRALHIALTARGYEVVTAQTGAAALAAAGNRPPELVVVDLGLPDMDGVEVVQALRAWSAVPVIVLSARHTEQAKINALDAGADDYVTKPFGMGEFLARVRAALRRSVSTEDQPVIETGVFTVDLAARTVVTAAGKVRLTPTEWHILEVLARNAGRLVTQRQLLHDVWGPQYETETNYLRVHMANLRRKLEPDPAAPRFLLTEPGLGYRLTVEL
ncbi:MAG TPA: response regulator [Micromonosporaceae bacterium]|jgi:two-component system KDP operon response regulator KdpE|nr:response regulator [Micromonosporaceae bacterium]